MAGSGRSIVEELASLPEFPKEMMACFALMGRQGMIKVATAFPQAAKGTR